MELAKKYIADHPTLFTDGDKGFMSMSPQEQITRLRVALVDDAGDNDKPGFWQKVWGFIKDAAPLIAGVVGKLALNPT